MMKTMACILSLQLTGLAWAPSAFAQPAVAPKPVLLETIEVVDDQVNIKLTEAPQYNSFLTANPPRLVIELLNTEYQAGAKAVEGKGRFVKRVRSGQFQRTPSMVSRIVVDLNEVAGYKVEEQAGGLAVKLVAAEASGPDEQAASEAPAAVPPAPAAPAEKPKVAAKPKAQDPAPMSTENDPALAAMAASRSADASSPPIEKPAPAPVAKYRAPGTFSNRSDIMSRLPKDRVSMDFDSMDIRDILSMLAQKAKINIIYGNDVSGTLTLHLSDVPFSEAFRTILTMMNLTTMQVGESILRVLTPAELARSRSATTAVTKVIPLNYTKASDLAVAINAVRTAEGRSGATTADSKTNSLIVTESVDSLLETERLISQLDVRPKQVLIEAKLIEVGLTNSLHYGIQWDYASFERGKAAGKQGLTTVGTSVGPDNATAIGFPADQNVGVQGFGVGTLPGAAGRGTGVALPASTVFGALTLGRVTNTYFLNATLTAAAAQGKVKVLSDPKIATMNNVAANINVTTQFPYTTSNVAATGVTTQQVAYVNTGIELTVTPTINADGRITLDINPRVSQPSATVAASITGAPAVDSRNAKTIVIVKDGETIVIGGLISDSTSDQIAKIPLLGDIPIIGYLFRKKSVVRTRSELLIFVTPKIMPD